MILYKSQEVIIIILVFSTGHGMDSRPAMAIFELLDYIVNEVWKITDRFSRYIIFCSSDDDFFSTATA